MGRANIMGRPKSVYKKAKPIDSRLPIGEKQDKFDVEDSSDAFKKRHLDPLTKHLGANGYFHKMRWDWFKVEFGGIRYPLEVDRYYHESSYGKIAIDICKEIKEDVKSLKKSLLEQQGIGYIIIESAGDLKSFAEKTS